MLKREKKGLGEPRRQVGLHPSRAGPAPGRGWHPRTERVGPGSRSVALRAWRQPLPRGWRWSVGLDPLRKCKEASLQAAQVCPLNVFAGLPVLDVRLARLCLAIHILSLICCTHYIPAQLGIQQAGSTEETASTSTGKKSCFFLSFFKNFFPKI